eukprot:263412-Chlamydomonas_euryale.AAC.2
MHGDGLPRLTRTGGQADRADTAVSTAHRTHMRIKGIPRAFSLPCTACTEYEKHAATLVQQRWRAHTLQARNSVRNLIRRCTHDGHAASGRTAAPHRSLGVAVQTLSLHAHPPCTHPLDNPS